MAKQLGVVCNWYARGPFAQMSEEELGRAIQLAASYWNACCGIKIVKSPSLARANLIIEQGPLYAAPPVLALPSMNASLDTQRGITLYVRPNWVIARNPKPGEMDIVRIIAHEMGHAALGISEHLPPGNLMAEEYSPDIRTPQEGDVREAISRF